MSMWRHVDLTQSVCAMLGHARLTIGTPGEPPTTDICPRCDFDFLASKRAALVRVVGRWPR
jgi:hypothetical protein